MHRLRVSHVLCWRGRRRVDRLVHRFGAGAALAGTGNECLGRVDERSDAATDSRSACHSSVDGLGTALADPFEHGGVQSGGGAPRVGQVGLPAASAAATRLCHRNRQRPRRRGTRRHRHTAGPARHRRLHGAGTGVLRLRTTGSRRRHQRATGGGAGSARNGGGRTGVDHPRPCRRRATAARRHAQRRGVLGRAHGAGSRGVYGTVARLCALSVACAVPVGGRR